MSPSPFVALALALGPSGVPATGPTAAPATGPTAAPVPVQSRAEPPPPPPGHGMVVAGVVLVTLGVAAWALMGAGLGVGNDAETRLDGLGSGADLERRRELLRRGRVGNGLAVGGGVAAAVLVGTGIPLIAIGRRRAIAASVAPTPSPSGAPTGMTVGVRLRF